MNHICLMLELCSMLLIGHLFVQGVETVDSSHLITPENIERLKQAKEANRVQVCSVVGSLSLSYDYLIHHCFLHHPVKLSIKHLPVFELY